MAKKPGKNITKARATIEARPYKLAEAAEAIKKAHFVKFDETVELVANLGVDPKQSDQMVRGTVVLPHGLGKSKRVLVIATGEKVREAQEAGADFVGGEDMVQKIQEGWTDFDAVIATPDMMRSAGRLGKVLGPRGMMPNPKTGTVTFEVAQRRQGNQGRKSGVSRGQAGNHPLADRQDQFRRGEARRKRARADRGDPEGQARGGQGQIRQESHADVHHGPGRNDRRGGSRIRRRGLSCAGMPQRCKTKAA